MIALEMKLLGDFALFGVPSARLPTRKAEALLAFLAMPAGRSHPREKLAALLWSDHGDANARHSLAQTLYLIRRTLGRNGGAALVTDDRSVTLAPSIFKIDVAEFESLLTRQSITALTDAVELYHGEFLDGVDIGVAEFEDWRLSEQERLRCAALGAMETLLRHRSDEGETAASIDLAHRLLALDPLNEAVHRTLMRLYSRSGRQEAALRQFQRCAEILKRELDIDPDGETRALHRDVLNQRMASRPISGAEGDRGISTASVGAVLDRPLVAVIPFDNISGDANQDYFTDGITEDLVAALSKLRAFDVIARSAINAYKIAAFPISLIAQELGVRYVIQGTVRKSSKRARISAQLIEAETGKQLWAENYDRALRDIFDLQDEMTNTITSAIEPQLSASERTRARRKAPNNLDAWDCYQRGLWHHLRFTSRDDERAGALFRRAIGLDQGFSLAYSGLAEHCCRVFSSGTASDPEATLNKALRSARNAMAADAEEPQAYFALGRVCTLLGDTEGAVELLEEALERNPNLADAAYTLGRALLWSGRAGEALMPLRRAIRQSPRDSKRVSFDLFMGISHFMLGEYEEAAFWLKRSSRASIEFFWPHLGLAAALAELGRMDGSREALKEALSIKPDLSCRTVAEYLRGQNPLYVDRYLSAVQKAGLQDLADVSNQADHLE